MQLQGKNAVVYGAAGHMGSAVTTAFAQAGARVFLVGRTHDKLDALAGKIRADGGQAEVAAFDATDQAAVDAHLSDVGRVDISFNALGLNVVQNVPLTEIEYEHFINPIIDAAKMHFVTATAAARRMVPQGSGVIIMLTASASWETRHQMGGFAPANAAVEALTRSLAGEVGRHGVRVVGLRTNLVPATLGITDADVQFMVDDTLLGRLPRLSDVAGTAVYLASDAASALTATTINHSCGAIVN
jgi:NAD(P)-dependent dehydrogenase (short-subunit alcohol dehydrogenase family)